MDEDLKKSVIKTGTTILGIVCKDGVVMAADKQATIGGSIVAKKDELKISNVNNHILVAGCGLAVEIQRVPKFLSAELRLKELRSKTKPTVKQAANLLSNIITSRQQAGFLIAGFNEDGTTELYTLDPVGHASKVDTYDANFGSGMPFVLGYLERQYKKGISLKEGIELAKESLKASTQRDTASGYGIDIFTISKEGIKKVVEEEIVPEYRDELSKK